jgi:hypothetical protein
MLFLAVLFAPVPALTSFLLRQNTSLNTLSTYMFSDSMRHKSSATPMSGAQISHQNIPMTSRLKPSTPKQNEISESISYRKPIWVDEMISGHQMWLTNEQLLQQHGHHSSTQLSTAN